MNYPSRNEKRLTCFPRGWLQSKWAVAAPITTGNSSKLKNPRFFPLAVFVLLFCFLPLSSPKVTKAGMRNPKGGTHRRHSTLELRGSLKSRLAKISRMAGGRSTEAGARVSPNHGHAQRAFGFVTWEKPFMWEEGLQLSTKTMLHSLREFSS